MTIGSSFEPGGTVKQDVAAGAGDGLGAGDAAGANAANAGAVKIAVPSRQEPISRRTQFRSFFIRVPHECVPRDRLGGRAIEVTCSLPKSP